MSEQAAPRVAVVTGASAGIGRATARMLVARGWHVVGTGRDPDRCAEAEGAIRAAAAPGARFDLVRGDFDSMHDVARVAGEIGALTDRIDVLVNNAGGVRDRLVTTPDGFEAIFAANHLAPFLLTRTLMPLLRRAAAAMPGGVARVVAVSSTAHEHCRGMDWDALNRPADTNAAYCQAKLANILFTRELDRRERPDGLVAQAMHPGRVASNFASHGGSAMQSYFATVETGSPDRAAETLVWLATGSEPGDEGGRYFHDMAEVPLGPVALDEAAARRLWTQSEALLAQVGL